jgi:hypothetical protein
MVVPSAVQNSVLGIQKQERLSHVKVEESEELL